MPLFDMECPKCEGVEEVFFLAREEHTAECSMCNEPMRKLPSLVNTSEWGSPQWDDAAQQRFGSRSERDQHYKALGYEPAGDKVGGARNEDHLHLGKRIVSDPKVKTRKTSAFANQTGDRSKR